MRKKLPLLSFSKRLLDYVHTFIANFPAFSVYSRQLDDPSLPYLTLIVSLLMFRYIKNRNVAVVIAVILSLYFGITGYFMNKHWKDGISFYTQCETYGTNEIGYLNLGVSYLNIDRNKAKYYYEKTIEKYPGYFLAYINLGFWHINNGEKEKGLAIVKKDWL
jgi:hypothetical protein